MTYVVTIKHFKTGEEQACLVEEDWRGSSMFLWAHGNNSCDCNRELYFKEAKGLGWNVDSVNCGDFRYRVIKIINPETGETYFEGSDLRGD